MKRLLCRLFGHNWRPMYRFDADHFLWGGGGFKWKCKRCGAVGASGGYHEDIRVLYDKELI